MEKQRRRGVAARCAALLCAAAMLLPAQVACAAEEANLAFQKPVEVSKEYGNTKQKLVDGDKTRDGRWLTEAPASEAHHAIVDLESVQKVNYFEITWESDVYCGADFKVYASTDKAKWGEPVKAWTNSKGGVTKVKLEQPVDARYIKLEVTRMNGGYGVSVAELEVRNIAGEVPNPDPGPQGPQDPQENIARKATVTTSSNEDGSLTGAKAVDGDKASKASRWASGVGAEKRPAWIQLDMGSTRDIKTIRVFWETRKPKSVKFQYADGAQVPTTEDGWKTAETTGRPNSKKQTIRLKDAVRARFVRVLVEDWDAKDPDGAVVWDNISMYELEVYGGEPARTLDEVLEEITVDEVAAGATELEYSLPQAPEGYELKYNGTDYEQVIDADGHIYRPLTDVTVKASFKITNTKNPADHAFKEFDVKVPGSLSASAGANAAPRVLPELREWVGGAGQFAAATAQRVVYGHDSLKAMATEFAADYQAITGVKLTVAQGTSAQAGDIFFTLGAKKDLGLKDEGYLLDAQADRMAVSAEEVAGANWGGKTILQGMKTGKNTFPVGQTRDYPLYRVRGIILDVGRKTFTLDWLKQMTKQMAFYKMNDFQIHLNDNLIPLEHYKDEDVFQAYSAFRLESNIKKGGKNKADLTAKDVWYSKADFKAYIEESAALGVNIIPEIDTPAHSLALTKVRPDLRHGTSGRQNDHLDIAKQYEECFGFVKSIFDEYLTGGDAATFAGTDTIHVGADEYTADGNAYRRFVNDMFKYTEAQGKKARVWGSLSSIKGTVEVKGVSEDGKHRREMNLWNPEWADLTDMYNLGFELIDCQDGVFYVVPNAGYYYDYLNEGTVYNDPLNAISGVEIPAGDPQVSGGAFAVWNDMCDYLDNGISEYDIYDRIDHALGLFAANSWGKNGMGIEDAKAVVSELGDAPNTDFGYEDTAASESGIYAHWAFEGTGADDSGMGRDLELGEGAQLVTVDGKKALKLSGGSASAEVKDGGLETLGLGNSLHVKVKRTDASATDQVLFESSYGAIKAVQGKTGHVGLSRENYDYSFNYALPVNEWVDLEFRNEFVRSGEKGFGRVSLYVNGELVDTIGDDERVEGKPLIATNMLPVARLGSAKDAFTGYVDDVRVARADGEPNSTMPLDYAVMTSERVLKNEDVAGLRELLDEAYALLREATPGAEAVADLAGRIDEALANAPYERADYARVDALRALAGNKDMAALMQPAAAQRLQTAVDQVRDDLPASMQATVNAYENAIANALKDQVELPQRDLRVIDPSLFKAEATSTQGGAGADKVLDGDLESIWHSNYDNGAVNADVTITLSLKDKVEPKDVGGLLVTSRRVGNNGNLKQYRVEVSMNGKDYVEVASGTAAFKDRVCEIPFETKQGVRAVRLVFVGAGENGHASAAEIRLLDANVKADIEGLNSILSFAKSLKRVGQGVGKASDSQVSYADAPWNALQDEIARAESLLAQQQLDPNEVQAQKLALAHAVYDLTLDGTAVEAPGEVTVIVDDRIPGHEALVLRLVEGDTLPVLPMPELAGYRFDGWYADGESGTWKDAWDFSTPVTKDLVLTAKWVESPSEPVFPGEIVPPTEPGDPQLPPSGGGSDQDLGSSSQQGAVQKPGSGLPSTGDNAMLVVGGVAALAVVALLAGVAVRRHRQS